MVLSSEQQKEWNSIIVDVLHSFIDICKKYNLVYYACGGTAIGAVRHNGIIPWDDDIDVFMPRPDYDKFVKLTINGFPGNYKLISPYNTKNYPLYFVKWTNTNTTLVENAKYPYVMGLYIDIFPLDGADADRNQAVLDQHKFRTTMNILEAISAHGSFLSYISLLKDKKEWGRFVHKTIGFFFRKPYRKYLLKKMESICRKNDFKDSVNVMAYSGSYGSREVFPKTWLNGIVELPFENLKINLFGGYDKYLRQLYGDYMQLPPINKRISHHHKTYFNLHERVSFNETKKYFSFED